MAPGRVEQYIRDNCECGAICGLALCFCVFGTFFFMPGVVILAVGQFNETSKLESERNTTTFPITNFTNITVNTQSDGTDTNTNDKSLTPFVIFILVGLLLLSCGCSCCYYLCKIYVWPPEETATQESLVLNSHVNRVPNREPVQPATQSQDTQTPCFWPQEPIQTSLQPNAPPIEQHPLHPPPYSEICPPAPSFGFNTTTGIPFADGRPVDGIQPSAPPAESQASALLPQQRVEPAVLPTYDEAIDIHKN